MTAGLSRIIRRGRYCEPRAAWRTCPTQVARAPCMNRAVAAESRECIFVRRDCCESRACRRAISVEAVAPRVDRATLVERGEGVLR